MLASLEFVRVVVARLLRREPRLRLLAQRSDRILQLTGFESTALCRPVKRVTLGYRSEQAPKHSQIVHPRLCERSGSSGMTCSMRERFRGQENSGFPEKRRRCACPRQTVPPFGCLARPNERWAGARSNREKC